MARPPNRFQYSSMAKVFIKTHGCQMNEYDSSKMVDLLSESQGYELTDDETEADLLLLNTCSIREKAQDKVFHQLGRWRKLKEKNPELKIGVGGCVASQEGEAIIVRAPFVDVTSRRVIQSGDTVYGFAAALDVPASSQGRLNL